MIQNQNQLKQTGMKRKSKMFFFSISWFFVKCLLHCDCRNSKKTDDISYIEKTKCFKNNFTLIEICGLENVTVATKKMKQMGS